MTRPLVFILGPTAVGKSNLALDAALRTGGAVCNCDSVQSYVHVQIGAAKPDRSARESVPHLMYDWVEPPHRLTAAEFRKKSLALLPEWLGRGPVFGVGGSGFYIQALEKGMYPVAKVSREVQMGWEEKLSQWGAESLYKKLQELDPEYAQRVKPMDGYRIVRALSLIQSEGRTLTDIRMEFENKKSVLPFKVFKVGLRLSRDELRHRVRERTSQMLRSGLIEEVRQLLDDGLESWPPLKSVGYAEVVQMLEGKLSTPTLEEAIVTSTMQLAKKQMTWFRRDPNIVWFHAESQRKASLNHIGEIVSE